MTYRKNIMAREKFTAHDVDHFEVLGDRYLVEMVDVPDRKTVGNIVIPDLGEAQRGWAVGRICKVGNGHRLETDVTVPMFFGEGDMIFFERLTGKDYHLGGSEYRILSQIDVLAKVND
jgi:co-chaperonin GroES (HSP10)